MLPRRFVPRAVFIAAARQATRVEYERLRTDLEAVTDSWARASMNRGLLVTSVLADHDRIDPARLPDDSAIEAWMEFQLSRTFSVTAR